ncbi:hypothetical protein [Legionella sainthelensi]|uniref:histidine kinase n=1 Tax=Legionella sainthelensi TaxID=28087 RepID=A0A2H5FRV8_9GAMM|nr:hypothetical protein [Legionella sainthelensi]AUH74292.1 hypothetical protein CAB17_20365 [Legionella sainthelensi]
MKGLVHKNSPMQLFFKFIHAINQPLTVIQAYLSGCEIRIKDHNLKPDQMMYVLKKIEEQTKVCNNIVNSMHKTLLQENISDLITEITTLFSLEITSHNIQLIIECDTNHFNFEGILFKQILFRILKQCINTVEKNKISNSILILGTKMQKNTFNMNIKCNFIIEKNELKEEILKCRTYLMRKNDSIRIEFLSDSTIFKLIMVNQGKEYGI